MNTVCAALLSWAVTLTGAAHPGSCPEIRQVSGEYLSERVCDGQCNVYGLYVYRERMIYMHERLDMHNPYHRSFLLHELIHHIQGQRGELPPEDCADHYAIERYAYGVQMEYLRRMGARGRVGTTAGGCLAAQ